LLQLNKKVLGLLVIIIASLSACDKIGYKESHILIDTDIQANFNYKPGTYWIYQDSLSGQVDSFYVTDNGGLRSTDENGVYLDAIGIIIKQKNISSIPGDDTIEWELGLMSNYISLSLQIGKTGKSTDYIEFPTFITYPFTLGQPIPRDFGGTSGGANVVSILSSYTLNARAYASVAVLDIINSSPQYNFNDQFFISADAGILKMKLNHANDGLLRNWELIRYNIVR
jgi:hypothetical protein